MLKKLDIFGNPYIGVFCQSGEDIAIIPSNLSKDMELEIEKALEVETIKTTLSSSTIIGVLMCINSYGAVVTNFSSDEELSILQKKVKVLRIPHRLNAAGNNILVNDNGALVNPDLSNKAIKEIEAVLGVETIKGTIAGMRTVGSAALATNKGVLCHPHTTDEEIDRLNIGTVNYGSPLIGACLIANTKGAVVGNATTPIELGRVEEALGYLD
jgi:translation initiation factor 6